MPTRASLQEIQNRNHKGKKKKDALIIINNATQLSHTVNQILK